MTLPLEDTGSVDQIETSDVSIIRRSFVDLTGDHFSAVILNQLLYWTLRVKDFDRLLEEERHFQPECNVSPRHGWIYKTAQELNEETMLGLSPPSIRKYLKLLIDEGWIDERNHPTAKWDRTTQYRVNVRKLQEDLFALGQILPEIYVKAFSSSLPSKSRQGVLEKTEETCNQRIFGSNERNFASSENSEESFDEEPHLSRENLNQRNFASNERIFASSERNFASNQKFFASNTENTAKTTHKNISKEQLAACARENFSDCKNLDEYTPDEFVSDMSVPDKSVLDEPAPDESAPDKSADESVAAEMLGLWERHVAQHLPAGSENGGFHLTEERKDQLESLFSFHFQNDIRLWERFCLRVKASSFLMGAGARKWHVRLGWLLREGNISKVLEGNYDESHRSERQDSCDWKLEKVQPNSALTAEKAAIVNSIKDPMWRKWCSRLAQGVRLNEFRMAPEPLSVFQLQQIANAWFLEVEDDRLVWVGSSDQRVLNKIEDLRLKISWVFKNEHPNASTFRTRLDTKHSLSSPHAIGENHHVQ